MIEGALAGELSCKAGELLYANQIGTAIRNYTLTRQLLHHRAVSRIAGHIDITREPPRAWLRARVLLNEGGTWLNMRSSQ